MQPKKKLKPSNRHSLRDSGDRISSLPETVLHHILSFLDMKYVVQTSILSRRWRYVWTSLPNLNFDHNVFPLHSSGNRKLEFMNFVDAVLLLRESSKIQKFFLSCDSFCDSRRVDIWISVAVKRNVQELYLEMTPEEPFELPPSLFTCESLGVLKLQSVVGYPCRLRLPVSMVSAGLHTMNLTEVRFPDANLNGELILTCPVLEDLIIKKCNLEHLKILKISAPQLKNLVVFMNGFLSPFAEFVIKICAPNLISFKCTDSVHRLYSLENLSAVVHADIDILVPGYRTYEKKEEYAQRVITFLKGLHTVKALMLSTGLLEFISEAPDVLIRMPTPFCNLRYLKLKIWLNCTYVHATYLLKCCPCIETLVVEIPKNNWLSALVEEAISSSAEMREQWEADSSLCMLNQLKYVEIRNFLGQKYQLKFVKFLLKNATVLEKMIIATLKISSREIENKLVEHSEELLTLPRASTSVAILFLLKS